MSKSLRELFKDIKHYPEPALSESVWRLVLTRQARATRAKSLAYMAIGIVSFVCLVIAIRDLATQFAKSGFYDYLSLAFSDSGSIALYWREFALSLADSLPVTSLVFSLLSIFVLFVSIKRVVQPHRNHLSIA